MNITFEQILAFKPCYDKAKIRALFGDRESVTWEQVAECEAVPLNDRVWLGTMLMDATQQRLFAVLCARYVLSQQATADPRSVSACDVAERFAVGDATQQELESARSAARSARSAAWSAAWSAAESAAESAAWSARSTAWSAVWSAVWSAAGSAGSAESAESAESAAQKRHLGYITNLLREDDDE